METLLYTLIGLVARIHSNIMMWNDNTHGFTDKELHFIVIGIVGICLVFVIHPLFKWLSRTGHTMVITFMYVFTVMIVLAFAIEIGQGFTGTGVMEFDDIVWGITGFLLLFFIFMIIRGIYHLILTAIRKHGEKKRYR